MCSSAVRPGAGPIIRKNGAITAGDIGGAHCCSRISRRVDHRHCRSFSLCRSLLAHRRQQGTRSDFVGHFGVLLQHHHLDRGLDPPSKEVTLPIGGDGQPIRCWARGSTIIGGPSHFTGCRSEVLGLMPAGTGSEPAPADPSPQSGPIAKQSSLSTHEALKPLRYSPSAWPRVPRSSRRRVDAISPYPLRRFEVPRPRTQGPGGPIP